MSETSGSGLERWTRILAVSAALGSLALTAYPFNRNQALAIAQSNRTHSIEAARPLLEKKLEWCEEAVEIVAGIAAHGRTSTVIDAASGRQVTRVNRFRALYWGVLGMVENQAVVDAMVAFQDGLSREPQIDQTNSLLLAHACREEIVHDWSSAWHAVHP